MQLHLKMPVLITTYCLVLLIRIPIATTTAVALADHYNKDVPYCFNRKEKKTMVKEATLLALSLKER